MFVLPEPEVENGYLQEVEEQVARPRVLQGDPTGLDRAGTEGRRGGIRGEEWRNVEIDRRIIRIWPSDEWQPKDNEAREVPINDALLSWLTGERRSERWVFPCPRTRERYRFWPQRKFDRARKAVGLTGGPHTLRHTYATHFLSTTPDLFLLARILGHSHQRVTELYAHLLPDHLARAARAVSLPCSMTSELARTKTVPVTVPKADREERGCELSY